MVSIGKGQLIYELSESKTLYLAYNATEGLGEQLARNSQVNWTELKEILETKYADEGTALEAMRALMKLAQSKGESPG